ncbi:hypothetical protein A2U01_0048653, partial [Trifolium medium]|nr:hypothetical protein [Trifolium medium]
RGYLSLDVAAVTIYIQLPLPPVLPVLRPVFGTVVLVNLTCLF